MHRFIKAVGAGAKRARALDAKEARAAMEELVSTAEPVQVGAFLLALRMKGETAAELAGFAHALAEHTVRGNALLGTIQVDAHGDGHLGVASLLPAAACAVAACDVPIWIDVELDSPYARHGLDGGLAAIGLAGRLDPGRASRDLERAGVAACDLALACPALERLVSLRPKLGVRTVAQTLAKLVTPIAARHRVLGAFHAPYVEPLAQALTLLGGLERGLVVQALGGLPEARPGKLVRVAYSGEARARSLDLRALAENVAAAESSDPTQESEDLAPQRNDSAAAAANRAALDGDPRIARQAAATAGVLLHAATGEDVIAAAERALAALLDGRARERAALLVDDGRA